MGWVEAIFGLKCAGCGKPLDQAVLCASCQRELVPRHVPGFVYLGDYHRFGSLSRAIKYKGQRELADFLAKKIALGVRQAEWGMDGITAVPTLMHRRVQRGYNQSELLAEAVAKELRLPYRPVLNRVIYTKSQTKKTFVERVQLPEDIFKPNLRVKGIWLLVDDVLTTGSTFSRAKKALLKAGAAKVYGAAIAVKSPHELSRFSL